LVSSNDIFLFFCGAGNEMVAEKDGGGANGAIKGKTPRIVEFC